MVLTVNQHIVHAFDNAGGLDRWDWTAPDNCTVRHALTGSQGVLIAMDCAGRNQLAFHDLITDTLKWTVNTGAAMMPIAADAFIGALDPATGTVFRYTEDKGAASQSAKLPVASVSASTGSGLPTAQAGITANDPAGNPVELVLLSGLAAFSQDGSLRWTAAATGPAWPVADAYLAAQLGADRVVLRRTDGGQAQTVSVLSPPAGSADSRVFPAGNALLLAGGAGTALYR